MRREARYAPPPGPHAAWRLSPPPFGSPGPVWCLVVEPSRAPPLLIQPEREGWVRVACASTQGRDHPPRRLRVDDVDVVGGPERGRIYDSSAPMFTPPPPVVRLIPSNPAATYGTAGPRVLTWPGKNAR